MEFSQWMLREFVRLKKKFIRVISGHMVRHCADVIARHFTIAQGTRLYISRQCMFSWMPQAEMAWWSIIVFY